MLTFLTTYKNSYSYIVFLDKTGRAEVHKSEYLPHFDNEQRLAMMDYGNPRSVFAGTVQANLMDEQEIRGAIWAHDYYSDVVQFEAGHRDRLENALAVVQKQSPLLKHVAITTMLY